MDIGETLLAVVCLVMPVVVLIGLALVWLFRPQTSLGSSDRTRYISTPAVVMVEQVYQTTQAVATATVTAIQSIQTSVVSQIGMVSHITIQAIGYVLAQLRGLHGAQVITLTTGTRTVNVIGQGQTYALTVGYQRQQPAGYRGAKVEPVEPNKPIALQLLVDGNGFSVSDQGEAALTITPGQNGEVTFQVRANKPGATTLQVNLYQNSAWAQQVDLELDVRPPTELQGLAASKGRVPPGQQVAITETLEGHNTLAIAPDPSPRHLHLNFAFAPGASEGRTYRVRGNNGQNWRNLDVTLRESDLAEINAALRAALDDVRKCFSDDVSLDKSQRAEFTEAFDRLARRGNAAFTSLFPDPADRAYVIQSLTQAPDANLEISTDYFFLPWELLYDSYDPDDVRWSGFWGFRFNISRVLTTIRQKRLPLIVAHGSPRVALFANPDLEYTRKLEIPFVRGLRQQHKIALWDWLQDRGPDYDKQPVRQQRSGFFEYTRQHESEIAHFACHAKADPAYSQNSYLELSDSLRIRLEDMQVEAYHLSGSPLVVLNACGTGVRDPLKTRDFVRRFMESGGRGVLATECDVPDRFASLFIQQVYAGLLAEKTLGVTLLEARQHFLREYENPLGLLYAAYAPLETKVKHRQANPKP